MRTIDADVLKGLVKIYLCELIVEHGVQVDIPKVDVGLCKIIDQQVAVGGWIPVDERYPDSEDYILLSFSNFSIPVVGRWEEDEQGGAFYVGDDEETCVSQDMFVNAWMPLPKVYSEEE